MYYFQLNNEEMIKKNKKLAFSYHVTRITNRRTDSFKQTQILYCLLQIPKQLNNFIGSIPLVQGRSRKTHTDAMPYLKISMPYLNNSQSLMHIVSYHFFNLTR